MGATIVLGGFFMFTNLVIDLVYAWLDPRIEDKFSYSYAYSRFER